MLAAGHSLAGRVPEPHSTHRRAPWALLLPRLQWPCSNQQISDSSCCDTVYQIDEPKDIPGALHGTLANKGNEAMAYIQVLLPDCCSELMLVIHADSSCLQFIIDYYHRLPKTIVFLHGHRWALTLCPPWFRS